MNKKIVVLEEIVRVQQFNKSDYISLTDVAKYKNVNDPRFVIQNWMRTRFTMDFLGIWEHLNNPKFNRVEFEAVKNESGSNAFVMTPYKMGKSYKRCGNFFQSWTIWWHLCTQGHSL